MAFQVAATLPSMPRSCAPIRLRLCVPGTAISPTDTWGLQINAKCKDASLSTLPLADYAAMNERKTGIAIESRDRNTIFDSRDILLWLRRERG